MSHWDVVYATKPAETVSWFQETPTTSLRLIRSVSGPAAPDGAVVDVGAGASTLVDHLLELGWQRVTLLDLSAEALGTVRDRLGERADAVALVVGSVLDWLPDRRYVLWHDRAVFHFLVEPADQARYVDTAAEAVAAGGHLVLGTFAEDGPAACSGLPTARWSADRLAAAFAPRFVLVQAEREEHVTPAGAVQPFTWVVLRREE